MEHGMLEGAVPTGVPSKPETSTDKPVGVPTGLPERWITQIQNGVVTLIQRIDADAFVVRAVDFPRVAANSELVSGEQAQAIIEAVRSRLD